MRRSPLSDKIINENNDFWLWDSVVRGLGVRKHKSKKVFVYRKKGSANSITIGDVGIMTLSQARSKAMDLGGIRLEEDRTTFADMASDWAEAHAVHHRKRYKSLDLPRLQKHVLPDIGHKLLNEVTVRDLIKIHLKVSQKGSVEANAVIQLIGAIYGKAIEWELFKGRNPATLVKKHPEYPRSRVASEQELSRLIPVLDDHPYGLIFILCLYCGLRKSEAIGIKWANVDFDRKIIVISKTKNGKDHSIKISDEIALKLKLHENPSEWVFYSSKRKSHIKEIKKIWAQILIESKIENLTIHDLRRTFATRLIENKVPLSHVQRALNHSSVKTTQRYVALSESHVHDVYDAANNIFKRKAV